MLGLPVFVVKRQLFIGICIGLLVTPMLLTYCVFKLQKSDAFEKLLPHRISNNEKLSWNQTVSSNRRSTRSNVSESKTFMALDDQTFKWSRLKISTVLPGVLVFQNVCIEPLQKPIVRKVNVYTGSTITFKETQRIVVYNSKVGEGFVNNKWRRLYSSHNKNTVWNHWDVHFRNSSIPSTHKLQNNTAFLLFETFPGNFHHFWSDEFLPLYWTIKSTNQLEKSKRNQLLYRIPTCLPVQKISCGYYRTYETMLQTLYTEKFHSVFFEMTPNTCFSAAVFGTNTHGLQNKREAIEHVLKGFGLPTIPLSEATYITFINRTRRSILNLDELAKAAREIGLGEVVVVKLEDMSIKSQAQLISKSRVLIGVQGAGLQWAMFMPPGSFMIEIAWSKKHWNFFFLDIMKSYHVRTVGIDTDDVEVNWTNYERATRKGIRIPDGERESMIKNPPASPHFNIYKYADCKVNKTRFVETLNLIKSQIP